MIEGYNSVLNSFLGTLLTWGLTALGSSMVFILPKEGPATSKILDASLGFAAGVMIAASFWSLLAPSIEKSEELGYEWTWFPAAVGFFAGGLGIAVAENFLPEESPENIMKQLSKRKKKKKLKTEDDDDNRRIVKNKKVHKNGLHHHQSNGNFSNGNRISNGNHNNLHYDEDEDDIRKQNSSFRRIFLLVLAITIHNFPEGLAVGVGFGAVETGTMTIHEARALAIGIGLQNFPEGLAVSMPLYRYGMTMSQSFWYGQLSGMVEPIAGVLGALLIRYANPILPYALSFAAGAMIYVVVDDLIPEVVASSNKNNDHNTSTWGCMIGFIVMMILDVALG